MLREHFDNRLSEAPLDILLRSPQFIQTGNPADLKMNHPLSAFGRQVRTVLGDNPVLS